MTNVFQNFFNNYLKPLLKKDRLLIKSKEKVELQQLQQQQQQQQPVGNISNVFEPYFLKIQNILIWKNPLLSLITIGLVNILFW